jgi:hypothetical protein
MITTGSPSTSPTSQFPRPRPPLVIGKIRRVHKFPRKPFGNGEAGVGASQLTHSRPVAPIKTIYIKLHNSFQLWARASSRLCRRRRFSQLCSSAVQRCLDAAHSGIDQFRNCQRAREAELPDKVFESLTCHLGVCSRGSRSKLSMRTHRRIQTVSAECWDDSAPRQYELPA